MTNKQYIMIIIIIVVIMMCRQAARQTVGLSGAELEV